MLSKAKLCSSLLSSPYNMSPLLKFLPTVSPMVREFSKFVDSNPGSSKNNKCSKYTLKSIYRRDPFDSRQEMAKDGYGITLYDMKDGERKSLPAVVARFKRLDWGQWIRFVTVISSDFFWTVIIQTSDWARQEGLEEECQAAD